MSMASVRHRRGREEEEDDDVGAEEMSSSSSSSPGPYDLELHSMTAKGIKHLCSELLEINKASEEDFRRNVYLSYFSFVRLFEEAGGLEKDVAHLKRQAMAQRSLIQHLTNNINLQHLHYSNSKEEEIDADDAPSSSTSCDTQTQLVDDQLDLLLCEHRMEQALELLEMQGQALQKMQDDGHPARLIASTMSALSARKARVADRLASLAGNPRTPRHELLRALSGLCKLGDAQRANHLLFKSCSYRQASSAQHQHQLLQPRQRNYIKELASSVFSSIVQASRSFVVLHGPHPSPYTSELIRWAREEMEDLSVAFHEYVKSISDAGEGLVLAIEAARCALSYCSLVKIALEEDLIALIQPCMEELLAMYAKHLKDVIRLFVSSDAWVLGRFRIRSPAAAAADVPEIEHCLLTTSGRKFVTLIQEVVEDVSPFLNLGMKSSVLQLLAELFREYMHSIVEVTPRKESTPADQEQQQQQYMWQLSVLINCTTLVSLFPIIAHGIFKINQQAPNQRELDGLILFIKEAAGQVWTQFCQQFIRDTMASLQTKQRTTSFRQGIFATSPQGMMPSFAFQVLFLRVRHLSNLYGTILTGKDGTMRELLQELMEAMIIWIHNNLDSWIHQAKNVPKDTLFHQIQLDVHFLLELAQVGGFYSNNMRSTALDLLGKAEEKVSSLEQNIMNSSGAICEEGWATDAAKRAVQVLMGAEANTSRTHEAANVKSEEDMLNAGGFGFSRNAKEGDDETDNQIDDSVASSGQKDMLRTWSNGHASSVALDETGACGCDGKSTDDFISIEGDRGAVEGSTEDDMSPGSPLGSTQVLDPANGEKKIISNRELLKGIPVDVHGTNQLGSGGTVLEASSQVHVLPETCSIGLGGSEICHTAMEEAPCDPQEDEGGDDESYCSFTTSPELLQDNSGTTPIPMVSDSADEETGIPDETAMSMSSTEGNEQQHSESDPGGSSSSSNNNRRRRQAKSSHAAADKGGGSRKKRGAMSRPRWQ